MSLKYEPASEPLHISVKQLFYLGDMVHSPASLSYLFSISVRGDILALAQEVVPLRLLVAEAHANAHRNHLGDVRWGGESKGDLRLRAPQASSLWLRLGINVRHRRQAVLGVCDQRQGEIETD